MPMSNSRFYSAIFVLNGSIHVACGYGGLSGTPALNSAERFNVASDSWTEVNAMHQAKAGFAAHACHGSGNEPLR
jgi:hypothetical protein